MDHQISTHVLFGVYAVNGVISALLYGIATSPAFKHARVLMLGLAYEVVICFVVSIGFPLSHIRYSGVIPDLTWVSIIIVVFPLLIPSPPRQTLFAALASAATVPLGLLVLQLAGSARPEPRDYIVVAISPALCRRVMRMPWSSFRE